MTAEGKTASKPAEGQDPEWLSKYPRKPLTDKQAREQHLDAELQDSFPASDPPSHSPPTPKDKAGQKA